MKTEFAFDKQINEVIGLSAAFTADTTRIMAGCWAKLLNAIEIEKQIRVRKA